MKKFSQWFVIAAAIILQATIFSNMAAAQDVSLRLQTEKLLTESDLVFFGKVIDVQFKDSVDAIPFTFVTYQISDVIAGRPDGDLVTLRFMGGRQQKGEVVRYLTVSESPEFHTGDTDVLFVRKNGLAICPLVDCTGGRFRTRDGILVNEDSFAILQANNAKALSLSTRMINVITGATQLLGKAISESIPDTAEPSSPVETATPIKLTQFVNDVKVQAKRVARFYDGSAVFLSASMKDDFRAPVFTEEAPPLESEPILARTSVVVASDFDRWEEAAVRNNNGNPVIK